MPYSQSTNDAYEYIELYNYSSNAIDLKNYKLAFPSVDITSSKVIAPKSTLVICTRNTSLKDFNSFYGTNLTDSNYLSLAQADLLGNNSSGCIILVKDDGTEITQANYTYNDFSEKKSIIYMYKPSSYVMQLIGRNQNPSPGYLYSGQVPYEGVKVTGVTLNRSQITMGLNEYYPLIATVSPETASNKAVTWSSSDTNVATVDNGIGLAGCAPITDFWAERSSDANVAQTVTALEKLYYQGIPGVEPVVKAENYGLPMGQLRVNLFKTPNPRTVPWSLREFLVSFDLDGRAIFKPEPVDDSPTAALFRIASGSSVFSEEDFNSFRDAFLGQPLCNLVNPDRIKKNASANDIINGISAGYDPRFNDFESISQGNADNPATETDLLLINQVKTRLAALSDLSGVSPAQLMNRAGTMTCGGCHQFSAEDGNNDLGNNATWPASLGFVHVDETGALSPLLNDVFIPQRIKIAQQFKENRAAFHQEAATCPGVAVAAKKVITSDVTKSREHDLYKSVDSIRTKIQKVIQASEAEPDKSAELQTMLQELKQATDSARKQESATQGVYTPARTH
jgi:hypothetical protein